MKTAWRLDPGQIEIVDDAVADVLRNKTPVQRVAMMLDANRTMRLIIESAVRRANPIWNNHQVRREIARRMLGGSGWIAEITGRSNLM